MSFNYMDYDLFNVNCTSFSKTYSLVSEIWKQVLNSSWGGWPFDHNRHGPKSGGVPILGAAGSSI